MKVCSFCSQSQNLQLLGCCLSFSCTDCIRIHSCSKPLRIISLENQLQDHKTSLKCRRCVQKEARVVCLDCRGKQLCLACAEIIHTEKYKLHQMKGIEVSEISSAKFCEQGREQCKTSNKKVVQSQQCNLSLNFQTANTQLGVYFDNMEMLKTSVQHKWLRLKLHALSFLDKINIQVQKRRNEILSEIDHLYELQISTIQKQLSELIVNKKSFQNFVELSKTNLQIQKIIKQKRILMAKNIAKCNKLLDPLSFPEYQINDKTLDQLIDRVQNLKILQKLKISQPSSQILKPSVRSTSRSIKRILINESPSKVYTATDRSHISSILEQPKNLKSSFNAYYQKEKNSSKSIHKSNCLSPRGHPLKQRTNTSRSSTGSNHQLLSQKYLNPKDVKLLQKSGTKNVRM